MIAISKTARLSALLLLTASISAFAMDKGAEKLITELKNLFPARERQYPTEASAILTNTYTPKTAKATTKQLKASIQDIETNCIKPLEWALKSGSYNDQKAQAAMDVCNTQIASLKNAIDAVNTSTAK
jgi:hypothetical protein